MAGEDQRIVLDIRRIVEQLGLRWPVELTVGQRPDAANGHHHCGERRCRLPESGTNLS